MRIWDLNTGEDVCSPIEVYDPDDVIVQVIYGGGASSSLIDVGSKASPVAVSGSIAAPLNPRQRSWLVGHSGPVTNPTMPGSGTGTQVPEWYLATTDNEDTITFQSPYPSGLTLSGPWTGGAGSILYLQGDGANGWIEGGRNEI